MSSTPTQSMILVGSLVLVTDQISKLLIVQFLGYGNQWILVDGFFKLVCWGNTGAAWSLFYGSNRILAILAVIAIIGLYLHRKHFDFHTKTGQIGMGLMLGGITGNLIDRLQVGHVVDFVYFFCVPRGGDEIGFPAFNVADASICSGVGLILFIAFKENRKARDSEDKKSSKRLASNN